jgi:hypothetical protein
VAGPDGADIGFALAATGYIGLVPTMLGNLLYLYGVAILGPGRAAAFLYLSPLFSAAFSSAGWTSNWPGTTRRSGGHLCRSDARQACSQANQHEVGARVIDFGTGRSHSDKMALRFLPWRIATAHDTSIFHGGAQRACVMRVSRG